MRYTYVYKTPDGIRHTDEMYAESREVVFETLRVKGIRAIKVMAADGSKANGETRDLKSGARVLIGVAAILTVLVLVLSWNMLKFSQEPGNNAQHDIVQKSPARSLPRQVIAGDRTRIENAPTNLFNTAAEVYLSRFAEPGRDFGGLVLTNLMDDAALMTMLDTPILVANDELTEHIDLQRITTNIKREMKSYILGGHTQAEYLAELVGRQRLEMSLREKAEKTLAQMLATRSVTPNTTYDYWLKANAQLQSMGIYPIPLPDALRNCQQPLSVD